MVEWGCFHEVRGSCGRKGSGSGRELVFCGMQKQKELNQMLVNIFRSYGERKRKCSGEDQNCKGRDSRKKYCVVQILLGAAR